jgi:hypothetical protein
MYTGYYVSLTTLASYPTGETVEVVTGLPGRAA